MPESTNSETWVLTEEDKIDAYKCILKLQRLETDLGNCDILLRAGRFFDTADDLKAGKVELQTAISDLQAFVKTLQLKKIWIDDSQ